MQSRSLPLVPAGACASCAYRDPCGGLEDESSLFGCFVDCGVLCKRDTGGKCDYTCPSKPRQFARRLREVGGLEVRLRGSLRSPASNFQTYVPFIRHGYRRELTLDEKHVAVPTYELVGGAGANYGPRARTARDLRDRLVLRSDAQVLFVSVAPDADLEKYWACANELSVPTKLAQLDLWAMTAPNFSFFDQVPRTQLLYNRARIVRALEALSAAGIPAIPHLNARTMMDWQFWADLLRAHPHVRHVAKEFQTGGRDPACAEEMIVGLRYVQDRVPQDLRPIIVGGTQYAARIARAFPLATFVDSRPFMAAVNRHRFVLDCRGAQWEPSPTKLGEPIDDLLADNIRNYRRYVETLVRTGTNADLPAVAMEEASELLVEGPEE